MPRKQIELKFPFKGLDESSAFTRQRGGQAAYSAAACMNVVGFDPSTGRNRGGARAGTTKFTTQRVKSASAGQCLVHVTTSPEVANRVTGASSSPASELRLTADGQARDLAPGTPIPVGSRSTTIVAVAGGDAAVVATSGVTAITNGTSAFSPTPSAIQAEPFFNDIFFADGAGYKYFDVSANLMANWVAEHGTLPSQEYETKAITGATNASPIVVTITAHGFTTGDQVVIAGVLGNTAANGTFYITVLTADTFSLTGSTGNGAYTSGGTCTVRRIGSRCNIMAVWGGRIVLSGMQTDPQNIFMSAVGDPFDWDYAPDVQTVTQAVAGNLTAGYGKNPDIVTALIPYTDDVLLVGGSRSIRKLMGNPAEGGLNVSVTEITGIAPGKAWCQSPEGIIYFFGSRGGIYKMDAGGGAPMRLTATTIDERMADVNLSTSVVSLLWDDRAIAIRVYITPTNGGATTHYVWDVRNEAWWPFSYTNNAHNPLAVHLLDGGAASERVVMEYGQDGYIRVVNVDATSDDGQPINSFVLIGPFADMMFYELNATMSEESNNVTWAILSANSEARALTIAPRATGRLRAGRNPTQWTRTYLERGYVKLSSLGAWAMETIVAGLEPGSETAQRVRRSNR